MWLIARTTRQDIQQRYVANYTYIQQRNVANYTDGKTRDTTKRSG